MFHLVELLSGLAHHSAEYVIGGRRSHFPSEEARREAWFDRADAIRERYAHRARPVWAAERYGWPA